MKNRKIKQLEAESRNKLRKNRSNKQQLETLDHRLGVGVGARKERERLSGGKQSNRKVQAAST